MVKRMSARQARNEFADVLGSVYYSKEPVIVEKRGKPFAVVVSVEDYEKMLREREERFTVFDDIRRDNAGKDEEEIEADVAREIAALRAEKAAGKQ